MKLWAWAACAASHHLVQARLGPTVAEVVENGCVEEKGLLADERDQAAQRVALDPRQGDAVELDGALIRLVKAQ